MDKKDKKLKINREKIIAVMSLVILAAVSLIVYFVNTNNNVSYLGEGENKFVFGRQASTSEDGKLIIHFIDVGQGESIFVQFPDGKNMLIDGGCPEKGNTIIDYLLGLNIEKINLVLATHSDNDHIGGLPAIFNRFEVEYCFRPMVFYSGKEKFGKNFNLKSNGKSPYKCKTDDYYGFLRAVDRENCGWKFFNHETDFSQSFTYNNETYSYSLDFLTPTADVSHITYYGANDYSPLCLLKYGEFSLMLTGDAGDQAEEEFLEYYKDNYPDVSVLKVGHHGSSKSTCWEFVDAINPEFAVISCGYKNEFGHPHEETLRTLNNAGCWIARTDLCGTIKLEVASDGSISFDPSIIEVGNE